MEKPKLPLRGSSPKTFVQSQPHRIRFERKGYSFYLHAQRLDQWEARVAAIKAGTAKQGSQWTEDDLFGKLRLSKREMAKAATTPSPPQFRFLSFMRFVIDDVELRGTLATADSGGEQ